MLAMRAAIFCLVMGSAAGTSFIMRLMLLMLPLLAHAIPLSSPWCI
jgi:hypothetical protein